MGALPSTQTILDAVKSHAGSAINLLAAEGRAKGNTGGWLCVLLVDRAHDFGHTPLLHLKFGTIEPPEDDAKCRSYSLEKAARLLGRPEDTSSRESRNPALHLYGGAIRAGSFILSFSGLPEEVDEAVMLRTALTLELLTATEVAIVAGDGNPFLDRLS